MRSDSGKAVRKPIRFYSFLLMIAGFLWITPQELSAQPNGESLFKANCSSCHSATAKKGTGPGLAGTTSRRSMEWILKWVANPPEMVKSGDATAVELMKEYNNFPMPPQAVNEEEVKAIFKFIDDKALADAEKAKADSLARVALAASIPAAKPMEPYLSNQMKVIILVLIGLFIGFLMFMRYINGTMVNAVGRGLPVFDNTENGWTDKWIDKNRPFAIFLGFMGIMVAIYLVYMYVSRF